MPLMNDNIVLAIVDDHPIVIEGLRTLLKEEPQITIAGSFTRGRDFMDFLQHNKVDLVLLDIMLPDTSGMDLCRDIKKMSPDTVVLALSNHTERSIILQILQNGASGYLVKNVSSTELLNCLKEALKGEIAFSKEVKEIITRPAQHEFKQVPTLTRREKQILQLVSQGKTTPMMAQELNVSPLTIETHRRNLLQKFDVKNVAELMMAAVQHKMITGL
ncbi:response regulator transcription factor [Chitinophaga oryzae]|uniref:Response regulator transcription factor n=1 Tax=Chitinophaga oryzae TaxID=2725414 RepID=A0AAE7D6C2_9BACT|nr:response regulator transcription factor [Chitinophaga oryzae]QJB31575.1 response regulator transcription factor [Chitinophaga oryzae]QJB38055.1 response regulator transcription factor [Chitinophaga oryzae]